MPSIDHIEYGYLNWRGRSCHIHTSPLHDRMMIIIIIMITTSTTTIITTITTC